MSKKRHIDDETPKPNGEQAAADVTQEPRQGGVVTISKEDFEKLQQQAQEAKEYYDLYLRELAEMENLRKRKEKDRQEYIKYANENLVADIIPIMDNFELAFKAAEKNPATHNFAVGVEMILGQLKELLKSYGVTEINPQGEQFNPHFHEAIEKVETDQSPENTVVEVLKKGYMLHERVLQPASVRIAVSSATVFETDIDHEEPEENEIL